ncbi:MAG: hypothetical protein LAO77_23115 [Acidobacteriia bacterium]|nr:hypothetical protein [Terriglobia bacterium]
MSDTATLVVNSRELQRALALFSRRAATQHDGPALAVDQDADVILLFQFLHRQHVDLGWRPQGLTLAPWAVESLARVLARLGGTALDAGADIPTPRPARAQGQRRATRRSAS